MLRDVGVSEHPNLTHRMMNRDEMLALSFQLVLLEIMAGTAVECIMV